MSPKEPFAKNNRGRKVPGIPGEPLPKYGKGGQINLHSKQPKSLRNPLVKNLVIFLVSVPYIAISLMLIFSDIVVPGVILLVVPIFLILFFWVVMKIDS